MKADIFESLGQSSKGAFVRRERADRESEKGH